MGEIDRVRHANGGEDILQLVDKPKRRMLADTILTASRCPRADAHGAGTRGETYWMRAGSEIPPGWASDGLFDILNIRSKDQKEKKHQHALRFAPLGQYRKEFGRAGDESVGGSVEEGWAFAVAAPATGRGGAIEVRVIGLYLPAMLPDCRSGGGAERAEEGIRGQFDYAVWVLTMFR